MDLYGVVDVCIKNAIELCVEEVVTVLPEQFCCEGVIFAVKMWLCLLEECVFMLVKLCFWFFCFSFACIFC